MTFYVIEFQTGDTGAAIVETFQNEQVARQRWHNIMAAASVSAVPKHGAVIMTEDLFQLAGEIAPRAVTVEE